MYYMTLDDQQHGANASISVIITTCTIYDVKSKLEMFVFYINPTASWVEMN